MPAVARDVSRDGHVSRRADDRVRVRCLPLLRSALRQAHARVRADRQCGGARDAGHAHADSCGHVHGSARAQALANNINRLDAVLFTHSHADHIHGLDEVHWRYNMVQKVSMPVYGDEQTLADLRASFRYIFNTPGDGWGVPQLTLFRIGGPFMRTAQSRDHSRADHARLAADSGFQDRHLCIPDRLQRHSRHDVAIARGCENGFVVDALRDRPHPTHFSVSQALDAVKRVAPDRAYFTHICHDLPHAATCARLPAGVELAYDGLVLDC